MQSIGLKCLTAILFVSMIPSPAVGSPLSFLRDQVQEEAEEQAVIDQNDIDDDYVVARPVVVSQSHSVSKGKNKFQINKKEWVQMPRSPPPAISVPMRSRVELECEAIGSPTPQIHWLRGGEPLRQLDELMGNSVADVDASSLSWGGVARATSRLVIDCASIRDHGLIHCAAVSGRRTVLSSPTMLLVTEINKANSSNCATESHPRVTLHSPIMMAMIGSTVVLPCRATGRPQPPRTFWLDNNGRLITPTSSSRYQVHGTGELVIDPLKWSDMGGYTCIAQSEQGKDVADTFLYPILSQDVQS